MIEQIECLSKLGFPLHEQLDKDAILNSLSKSYLSFLSHYRMTKPTVNYYNLLGLLQTFEKNHQPKKEQVHVVRGSFVGRRSSKREKKKRCRKIMPSIQSRVKSLKLVRVRRNASFARSWIIEKEIILLIQLSLTQTCLRTREISNRLLHKVLI